tara:strand:+ start:2761 stop:6267 length:3507 start_codon:yes stop_codon:yes gene_type:complete
MKSRALGTDSTWKPVDYEYKSDSDVYLKDKKTYHTAEGWSLLTLPALGSVVDQSTNQYSNLYLTDRKKLSDFIGLVANIAEYPRTYVTYFADTYGWVDRISPDTKCWHITDTTDTQEEMEYAGTLPAFRADTPYSNLSTETMFEVKLLSDRLLKISHWDGYKVSYLTANESDKTLYFNFNNKNTSISESNTQVFEYSLDNNIACITLYRLIDGIYYEFRYVPETTELTFFPTTAFNYIPNPYKNTAPSDIINDIPIYDTWVAYGDDINQNNVAVDKSKSFKNLRHNYLLNTEYVYDDGAKSNINLMPLKNHITSSYSQSRTSPFRFLQSDRGDIVEPTLFRDYTCINTGGNTNTGLDNMYLSYRDYTRELIFKSDEVTYFHMPPDMYPFKVLNISEAGLIESGAIAGDQPVRSDKVFKKRANYSDYGPWGDSIDEQSGTYLCTWLYNPGDPDAPSVWLDRYYNPQKYTVYEAMQLTPIVEFISTFDNMTLDNIATQHHVVFDKVSDLCFEPSSLYCYHHIGQTDIQNSIKKLSSHAVQSGADVYNKTTGAKAQLTYDTDNTPIYTFTGEEYAQTGMLSSLTNTNSFSVTYSMYSDDWSKPFGYQVLGNYTDEGFGIFNKTLITTTLMSEETSAVKVYNTSLDSLLIVDDIDPVLHSFKSPLTDNIFIYNREADGTLYEFTPTGILREETNIGIYESVYPYSPIYPDSFTQDDQYLYLIYNTTSYYRVDLLNEKLTRTDEQVIVLDNTDSASEIIHNVAITGKLYSIQSDICTNTSEKIYWLVGNQINLYDCTNDMYGTLMEVSDYVVRDIKVDVTGCVYVLYREYTPVNTRNPHYILKLNPDESYSYNVSLSSLSTSLSTLDSDSKFLLNQVIEHAPTETDHYLSMMTDYLSTYTIIDDNTNEPVDITLNYTQVTNIDISTGNLLSSNINHQPLSAYNKLTSNYQQLMYRDLSELSNNELIFRLKLQNTYDRDDYEMVINKVDVSTFDKGWHQICYDYNADTGLAMVFVDSMLIDTGKVPPAKYRFSDLSTQKYTIGSTPTINGILLSEHLKKPGYYSSRNFKIKNLTIYNTSLNYYDIKFLYRDIASIRDIKWTVPGNSRNYVDEIQHVFNHNTPPIKSKDFDINILSDTITDSSLRESLAADIRLRLVDQLPLNTTCDTVSWYRSR